MKRIYNYFSMSQTHLSARAFLLPLVLLTLISFSGTVTFVSAQTTVEVCRETKKVMDQYLREDGEVLDRRVFKDKEAIMLRYLSVLNNAVSNHSSMTERDLREMMRELLILPPKEIARMTIEERIAFQREIRNFLHQKIQSLSDVTMRELDQQSERIYEQLTIRQERFKALNCEEVLRNQTDTTGACTLEGTWTHITDKVGETTWRITPDGKAKETGKGNADGTATLSGRMLQIEWKTTNGYSGLYKWNLDESCNAGSGSLRFDSGTTGTYTSQVTRQ